MPRPRISSDSARLRFLLAAYELFKQHVEDNPWQTLKDEAFPAWSAINYPRERSPQRDPLPLYVGSETWARRAKEGREVLGQWALRYNLVVSADLGPQPADWILDHAEELCRIWRGMPPTESTWEDAYQRAIMNFDELQRSQNSPQKARLPRSFTAHSSLQPPIPYLTVPMEYPDWDPGTEAFADYKRRVRRALKAYFRFLRRPRARPPAARELQPTGGAQLFHYEWVILRRCCRWKLKEIRARYLPNHPDPLGAESVVSQAVSRTDALLGLVPLAKIQNPT
jgi:hypothetical protein